MSLNGKTIVFTGTLHMKRDDASLQAEKAGAKVSGTVTANTDILVCGSGVGAKKTDDAQKKGVEVWTEEQFTSALRHGGSSASGSSSSSKKRKEPAPTAATAAKKSKASEQESAPGESAASAAQAKGRKKAVAPPVEEEDQPAAKKGKEVPASTSAAASPDLLLTHVHQGKDRNEFMQDEVKRLKGTDPKLKHAAAFKLAAANWEAIVVAAAEAGAPPASPVASSKSSSKTGKDPAPPSSPPPSAVIKTPKEAPRTPGVDRIARSLGASVLAEYDTKLNQTVVDGPVNSNKFYILQVLEKGGSFACWNRWGRLGEDGQNNLSKLKWGCKEEAVNDFEKKFKEKSANAWADRSSFVKKPGKYQLVEVEDEGETFDPGSAGGGAALGKLTREQIEKGQAVLLQVRTCLEAGGKVPPALTNSFYSLIPTVSGRAKPAMLGNYTILGEKEAQLEFWLRMAFEDMSISTKNPLSNLSSVPCPVDLYAAASSISDLGSISSSVARGQVLAKQKAGAPVKAMNEHKYAAIVLYTGNSIYRELNEALRVKHAAVPRYLPYVQLFLSAAHCLPKKAETLWRGIAADLYDEYEVGKMITWWTVSSTTASEGVARAFMSQLGGVATLLTIESSSALNIEPLSVYPHEKESLLVPGTKLLVLSRCKKGSVCEIRCKEVGNAINDV